MASLILPLAAGSTKTDGTVNSGGRVYLYSPGTGISLDAYADRDKSALATRTSGYYPLDPAGRAYLWVDVPCTVREETSGGTLVREYPTGTDVNAGVVEVLNDGFTGTLPDGSTGAGGRTYLDAKLTRAYESFGGLDFKFRGLYGTQDRAVGEELEEIWLNVKRFGAVGNGVADDTAAIQAALNAAAALGGGVVYLPPGTYNISAALTVGTGGATIAGAGVTSTTIRQMSTTANTVTWTSSGACLVRDINITANTSTTGTAFAISGGGRCDVAAVAITGHANGIIGSSLATTNIWRCTISVTTTCIRITSLTSLVSGCLLTGATAVLVSNAGAAAYCGIVACKALDATTAYDITSTGASATVALIGCTSSNAATADLAISATTTCVTVDGCSFFTAVADGRTGTPVAFSVGTTSSVTPLPLRVPATLIDGTAGGITITVGAPADSFHGAEHTVICKNSSGGAVTWAFPSPWVLSATGVPTPATGNQTQIKFTYDKIQDRWRELNRGSTAT